MIIFCLQNYSYCLFLVKKMQVFSLYLAFAKIKRFNGDYKNTNSRIASYQA